MCGEQTAEGPPGSGVTGGTKGIRDACLSERLQHGGRPGKCDSGPFPESLVA